jgi:acyl-CoA synthetase (NDP forming)
VALLSQFGPLGLGVSTLVSTGDKYDVSGNDLLRWWCDDEHTHVAVLYLESFGNPTKFSRLARRLGRRIPVIALRTGSTEPAQRAAASHTAAAATPAVTRDALYRQAGVIAVDTLTELLATTALLSWQPVPAGGNVLVIGNAGGFGVLAADACARLGLVLPELSAHTRAALAELLPSHASLHNPVDTTAGVGATTFESCLDAVLADEQVHAVIVSAAPTALGDPGAAIGRALARARRHGTGTPVLAVAAGQPEMVAPHRVGKAGIVPSYADPALAAQALAHAVDYGRWRARPAGVLPELPGLDAAPAQDLVAGFLAEHPNGGWLDPGAVQTLLSCFGVPVLSGTVAATDREALAALRAAGGPVALKAVAPGVLHKSRSHGVVLGVADEQRLTTELAGLRERFGERLTGVFVQPMAAAGRELLIGVHSDGTFGPLVVFGLGGVDADLITDRAARLVPLTDVDADDLMASLRSSPTLFTPSSAELDPAAVRDVLLRTGRLAELLPQIAELDLNPVIATPDGATVIDARIRLRPAAHTDPTLRALRA